MDPSLEAQLRVLLDKQAIHELVMAYFSAADRHDHERMRQLYHEDAIDDHGHFFKGPAMEFIDKLPAIQAGMAILHHNASTVNLKLDGDRAEGEVYALAFHKVKNDGAGFDVLIGARYFDKYEKRAGAWKFSHRAIVADWAWVNEPSQVRLEHPFLAGAHIGRPGPTDPSYGFFSMLQRGQR
jgi:hypothetical protein